jgi:acyl-CoA synthetase (AMP-forming)/AMP-acid ligase II
MGLVLMALVPLLVGARLVLLPSSLADVRAWLGAIAHYRGTFTAAPDFAYRLCLYAVRDPSRFDLKSLRVALNAAEPVRWETIRRFHETFGLERVMVPGYGLAEATVGVSMQPPGTTPKVSERGLVAIGRPFPGVELEIWGENRPAEIGEVGELVVRSPAVTLGYFGDPQGSAELFAAPGAIRTGDLAFRDEEGEVFLVGRKKSIILQAGRNLAPVEIETAVERLPFVRRAAALGVDRGRLEGEQAYLFVELKRMRPPPTEVLREWARQVVEAVHRRLGIRPGRVVLVKPRSIPLTDNGKIRYPTLREAYLGGCLAAQGRIFDPVG